MTSPSPLTPEKIAAGLTEAQREALTQPLRYSHGNSIMKKCPSSTFGFLNRNGLADGACLTPLGLAVRGVLQREDRS